MHTHVMTEKKNVSFVFKLSNIFIIFFFYIIFNINIIDVFNKKKQCFPNNKLAVMKLDNYLTTSEFSNCYGI